MKFFYFLGWKRIISVLFELSEIWFALSYCTICTKSWLIYLFIFLSDLFKKKKEHLYFVLSAKWWINECEIASFRSLMYIRKSKGPGTDPCGTPYDITVLLERVLFIEVCCF